RADAHGRGAAHPRSLHGGTLSGRQPLRGALRAARRLHRHRAPRARRAHRADRGRGERVRAPPGAPLPHGARQLLQLLRLLVMRRAALAILACAMTALAPTFAAGWDVGALMALLRANPAGRAHFVETKEITSLLDRPLES